jgi:hypothetical protein
MSRVFLSHSGLNNAEAVAIRDWLATEGWEDVFFDVGPPGERWEQAFKLAVSRCEVVLFLISQSWLESAWCLRAVLLALMLGKRSFGVLIEAIALERLPTMKWQVVDLAVDLTSGQDHTRFRVQLPQHEEVDVTFSTEGLARLRDCLALARDEKDELSLHQPKVFISYRREESKYQAKRLHDALLKALPAEHVFMDIDSVPLGADFVNILEGWVDKCDILMALIGPHWTEAIDPKTNKRRLDSSDDFVRIEIRQALRREIQVVPVLLDLPTMPSAENLPEDIRKLVRRQAALVEFRTFDTDVKRLIRKLGIKRQRRSGKKA